MLPPEFETWLTVERYSGPMPKQPPITLAEWREAEAWVRAIHASFPAPESDWVDDFHAASERNLTRAPLKSKPYADLERR